MKNNVHATDHHQQQGKKLVTPEMRRQVRQVKRRLDECDGRLSRLFDLLNEVREGLDTTRESARCLLREDPFAAWEKRKRAKEEEYDILWGISETKKRDAKPSHQAKAAVEKLTTPQMRQQIVEAIEKLEDYAGCLREFFDDVTELGTLDRALELAEDLLCAEPLETWDARKKQQEEAAAAGDEDLIDEL